MRSVQKKKPVHYIDYIGAELVRGRVCGGRVCLGPSLSGAEFVRGRDVQKPIEEQAIIGKSLGVRGQ